jgi:hypothetical protein
MNMTIASTSTVDPLAPHAISCDGFDIDDFEDEEYLDLLHQQEIELNELKQQHKKQLEEFSKILFDEHEILSCSNKSSSIRRLIIL